MASMRGPMGPGPYSTMGTMDMMDAGPGPYSTIGTMDHMGQGPYSTVGPMNSMGPGPMGPGPMNSMGPGPMPGPMNSMGPSPMNSMGPGPMNSRGPGPMNSMGPPMNSRGPGPMNSMGPGPMNSRGPGPMNSMGPGPMVPMGSMPSMAPNSPFSSVRGPQGPPMTMVPAQMPPASQPVPARQPMSPEQYAVAKKELNECVVKGYLWYKPLVADRKTKEDYDPFAARRGLDAALTRRQELLQSLNEVTNSRGAAPPAQAQSLVSRYDQPLSKAVEQNLVATSALSFDLLVALGLV
ncbi:unnamed protein product [Symbiodinium natans]|uniref:Uncharacterized protein n=1 Tax=Symbiodinium natans TaxID=878477 RepID=A0A812PPZ5_9DINO|nr:unnamed protein product [Symbiodinium natans]